MSMSQKEKEVLFSSIQENLGGIVGASGQPEELVRLTTSIVQGTKRLLEGVPENLSASCTNALTSFVICAKSVAQNPRGVDATVIKQLSNTRSEVERNVNSLGKWHFRTKSPLPEDLTQVMEAISRPPQENRVSPEACSDAERERKLTWDLQRRRDTLLMKMDPGTPDHINDPQDLMVTAVQGLMKGADELTKHTDGKMPSKDLLLEPMILVVDMVCKLLDLVDSLFVSKYPMRSQVYSFCTALIDNVTAYGQRSKSDNVLSLRNISTQTPALLNASKVMVEQCEIRLSSLQMNMDKSMMRTKAMKQMDTKEDKQSNGSPLAKKKIAPATAPPPTKETKPEFEVCCMVCTSVAVDQKTQQPISRGTELSIMIPMASTVKDVKKDLASRTGLLYGDIQLNQGQDELTDGIIINPNNPLPYFLFNREEPTEDEIKEQRKMDRNKSRVTLENLEWSNVTGPVAVAVFDYDTLGDQKSLAFDEGDIIEIIEKSADGWWEGRSGDKTGTFPASFVKEITSTDEGHKALEKAKGGGVVIEEEPEEAVSIDRHSSEPRITSSHSPKPNTKKKKNIISRGMSNPDFSVGDFSKVREIKEKGRGIFQKKKKGSGYANLNVVDERIEQRTESPNETSPTKSSSSPKPLFKPRKSFGSNSGVARPPRVLGDDLEPPPPPAKETNEPKGSPIMIEKMAKKRPPPPKPQPFAKTHPNQAAKLNLLIQAQGDDEEEDKDGDKEGIVFQVQSKKSNSMEDLLKDLEDFENAEAEDRSGSVSSNQLSSIEYETYERPQTPEREPLKDVETIKISEYKSDSENDEDVDTDDQLDEDEQVETNHHSGQIKPKHNGQEMSSLKVSGDEWKPHEWVPSPEPPTRKGRKPPSWSIDVKNPPQHGGRSNGITKATSFDQSNPEPPVVMAKPKRSSASLRKPSPSPKVPAPSMSSSSSANNTQSPSEVQSPQKPVAPPRYKKKGGQSPSLNNSADRRAPTRAPPPPPPNKPTAFPTSKSDIGIHSSSNSSGLQRRMTVTKQREKLRSKPTVKSRSPIMQRKTKAVFKGGLHLGKEFIDTDDIQICTGVGKEGILYKEASQNTADWKPRYFQLVEDGLLYYESNKPNKDPLGEIPVNRIIKALPIESSDGPQYHCFILLMRYGTTTLLGAELKEDADDWIASINAAIKIAWIKEKPLSFVPSLNTIEYCLQYLLTVSVSLSKRVFKLSHDIGQISEWMQNINDGQHPDLSHLCNPSSAVCLLKALLVPERIGYIVPSEIAKEISSQVKKSAQMADIQSKLHHIHDDLLHLLYLFLSVFVKALNNTDQKSSDKLEVSDFNRMFGASLFEGLKPNQSLTLLAFMIKNNSAMF